MPKRQLVMLASRTLSVVFTVSALVELSYVPERLHSFLHYVSVQQGSNYVQYLRHYYLISLGFLIVRIVGLFLMGMWMRKCGSDVEELLWPSSDEDRTAQF